MPDQAVYELGVTQVLHGVPRRTTMYFLQSGADEGLARSAEDAFIDSFEADDAFAAWRGMVSDQLSFICISAQQVLPTVGLKFVQFGALAGALPDEGYPSKSNILISWYAQNVYTKKGRSRNWFPGVTETRSQQGRINEAQEALCSDFCDKLAVITAVFAGGTEYLHSLITSRSEVPGELGKPLDSELRNKYEVRPRLYNLRNSKPSLCGT